MKTIKCKCGKDITIDDEDYFRVTNVNIYCSGRSLQVSIKHERSGAWHRVALASFIKNNYSQLYDHINRDLHYNTKENLRVSTINQNAQNKSPQKNNLSGYKGVALMVDHPRPKPWQMKIQGNGKRVQSYHTTAFDAGWEYNKLAKALHGEFAFLNNLTRDPEFIGPILPL